MTDTSAELGAESVKRDRLTLALLAVSIFLLPFLVTVACLVFNLAAQLLRSAEHQQICAQRRKIGQRCEAVRRNVHHRG